MTLSQIKQFNKVEEMSRYKKSEGLVLTKKNLLRNDKFVIIFSQDFGKITLLAKGVKKIKSKRLSHLETGNYIKFSFYKKGERLYLRETELLWGHSKIKSSRRKLQLLYLAFLILNKILPEEQKEAKIFERTLLFLKNLNNQSANIDKLKAYLGDLLVSSGFVGLEKLEDPAFNIFRYLEELIGQRIRVERII